MKIFYKYTRFTVSILFWLTLLISSCRTNEKIPQEVKDAEKAEMQLQKEEEKQYKAAVRQHQKIQSAETKKDMKNMKKQSAKVNKFQKRSFWDRLFNRNCP